jgi:hypothetical protein
MQPKFFITTLLVVIMVSATNAACGLPFLAKPTPTPTINPTPTFTPTFTPTLTLTSTPSPTNTSTPTATPTLDLKATQAFEHAQVARDILSELSLPADSGKLGWYQTVGTAIILSDRSVQMNRINELKKIGDFVFATEMTWDTDAWPVCGLMFRVDNRWGKGNYYVAQFLRFSGLPGWDIEYFKDGELAGIPTEKTRFSSYLNLDSGAKNEIVLASVGNEFKLWINNNFEGRYYDYDSKLKDGGLAFLGWQYSGKTTCTFNNSWIWVYK